MANRDLLKRFIAFALGVSKSDRVALLVHADGDGLMSGAIASRGLKATRNRPADFFLALGYLGPETLRRKLFDLKSRGVTKILVLDLGLDQDKTLFETAESFAEVLFIDHHKFYQDFNSEKTVYLKASVLWPRKNPAQYPASKMVFDLFSKIVDLSDSAWLACVGIFADCSRRQWKSFFSRSVREIHSSESEIASVCRVIDAVGIIDHQRFEELYRLFLRALSPSEILASPFSSLSKDLETELAYWLSEFEKKGEFVEDLELVWFVFTPRFGIKSPLINAISIDRFPDKTVVLVQLLDGSPHALISGRRQDGKMKVNDLLERSVAGIAGGSAGGHGPAAAGKVPRGELERFRANLESEIKKMRSESR